MTDTPSLAASSTTDFARVASDAAKAARSGEEAVTEHAQSAEFAQELIRVRAMFESTFIKLNAGQASDPAAPSSAAGASAGESIRRKSDHTTPDKRSAKSQLVNAATVDLAELAAQELRAGGETGAVAAQVAAQAQAPSDPVLLPNRGNRDAESNWAESASDTEGRDGARWSESANDGPVLPRSQSAGEPSNITASPTSGAIGGGGGGEGGVKSTAIASQMQAGSSFSSNPSEVASSDAVKAAPGRTQTKDVAPAELGTANTPKLLDAKGALAKLGVRSPFSLRSAEPAVEPEHLAKQVSRALTAALKQGEGTLTLRLAPSALGDLKISLLKSDQLLIGLIEPTTDVAHQLLTESVDSLRRSLEAAGIAVDEIRIAEPTGASDLAPRAAPEAHAREQVKPRDEWNSPRPATPDGVHDPTQGNPGGHREQRHEAHGGAHHTRRDAEHAGTGSDPTSPWMTPLPSASMTWTTSPEGPVRLSIDALV
jgi:flagellar hook-length control protein FliK